MLNPEAILQHLERGDCQTWPLRKCLKVADLLIEAGLPLPLDLYTRLLGLGVDVSLLFKTTN